MLLKPRLKSEYVLWPQRRRAIFGGGGGGGAAVATTLILDNFTDTDATALASHTIAPTNTPATSWTQRAGAWTISSNKAVQSETSGLQYIAACNPGVADCTISLAILTAVSGDFGTGIIARYQDSTHYWLLRLSSAGQLQIYENNAGFTLRASAAKTLSNNTVYTLVAVLSGSNISLTVDATSCNYSSSLFATQTAHGMNEYRDLVSVQPNSFDDFKVTSP